MKALMKNLALLSMGLMIYSCNEKISPELQNGNSTTVPTAVVPTEYYFKVENTSPTVLNYKLHRTGANNQSAKCQVTSTSTTWGALSDTNFYNENIAIPATTSWDSKEFDKSCYFEAEELSLYYSGFQFKISASPNTCAYVGYTPFSFYDRIPGDSSTSYTHVNCDDAVTTGAQVAADPFGDTDYGAGLKLDCGQYADIGITVSTARAVRAPAAEENLCTFNYGNGKECDEGIIIINDIDVSWVEEVPAVEDDPDTTTVDETAALVSAHAEARLGSTRTISCGGDHLNCVEGPIKKLSYIYAAASTEINPTTYNEAFSKEYTYDGLYPAMKSNKKYVNFRRDLANPDIDFTDSDRTLPGHLGVYAPLYNAETSYNPLLMDLYSYNLLWDGTNSAVDATALAAQTIINGYTAKPYAAEPFLGLDEHRVNPFYTFYCFDEALEIKARVRMVVREWDRVFPTANTSLSLISDIGSLGSARQDYGYGQTNQNPGDPDGYNAYNDLQDWDDYLFMLRTPGVVLPGTTWNPKSGFFNPLIFTNGKL